MKLGFVSALLSECSFEQVIDTASELGYECVEVASWPSGKKDRRYAGVSHIDADALSDVKIQYISDYCASRGVAISSLAYYPNPMSHDLDIRYAAIEHIKKLIIAAKRLGINLITTFIGRDQTKNIEDNLSLFMEIWPPIIKLAEEQGVRIAIENCPMLFGAEQWPGGQNLASTPAIWRQLFERIPSDYFGLNFDPSHFVWQQMDYIRPIYEFSDKIFHAHYKDIMIYPDKLADVGVLAYPLEFMRPCIPGHGNMNWGKYIGALMDVGFDKCCCVEIEDISFEKNTQDKLRSLVLSKRYLENYMI